MRVQVTINGKRQDVDGDATVATVVRSLPGTPDGRGVAVAVSGEVIPKSAWSSTRLREGDSLEVVVAVQGG